MKNKDKSEEQPIKRTTKMISVRFDAEDVEALTALAHEHGETLSSVIRIATKASLEKYLGTVKYIDKEQAKRINKNIVSLGNVMVSIKDECRRIGLNLNQTTRAINAGKVRVIDRNSNIPSAEDFEKIMSRLDAAIQKAGELYVFQNQPM
jgi:hypothetical protein